MAQSTITAAKLDAAASACDKATYIADLLCDQLTKHFTVYFLLLYHTIPYNTIPKNSFKCYYSILNRIWIFLDFLKNPYSNYTAILANIWHDDLARFAPFCVKKNYCIVTSVKNWFRNRWKNDRYAPIHYHHKLHWNRGKQYSGLSYKVRLWAPTLLADPRKVNIKSTLFK